MSDTRAYQDVDPNFDPMTDNPSNGIQLTADELNAIAKMRGQFKGPRRVDALNPLNRLETTVVELKLLPRWPLVKTLATTGAVFVASNVWFFSLGLDAHKADAQQANTPAAASADPKAAAPKP